MPEIICLNFDGVIHGYTTSWTAFDDIPDPPTPGALEAVNELIARGFEVVIHSTRLVGGDGAYWAMRKWLRAHGFPPLRLTADKPPAMVYVDDRAYRFDGRWTAVLDFIGQPGMTPKPWNKV